MRIAINGCGIAGPTLAWWLRHHGHVPVLFERASEPRRGGYLVDFWGTGFDVADRMGILPALRRDSYAMERIRTVTARGRTTSSIGVDVIHEITGGRYFSIARSDLSARIVEACDGIEIRFGTAVTDLEDRGDRVAAALSTGSTELFDLVVGADGLHSAIRRVAFGPQETFERRLGMNVAAFTLTGYAPRDELTAVSHTLPGRYISRVSLREDRTLFLFVFSDRYLPSGQLGDAAVSDLLSRIYRGTGWESAGILARIGEAEDLYFDRASQIRMPSWSRGRVALVGDAAACPSLLAGEGSSMGMAEAYVLAGELARAGADPAAAFNTYEARLKSFVIGKQDAALRFAGYFAPRTWPGLILRDAMSNVASVPILARWMLASSFRDNLTLPSG